MGFRQISPRPLGLHLATAMSGLTTAAAAAPLAASGGIPWHGDLQAEAEALNRDLAGVDASQFASAVWEKVSASITAMLDGIRAYQSHPAHRPESSGNVVWRCGAAELYDFGGPGRPLLMAPSLVNRSHVLDLDHDASLARWLADQGHVRPFLLDWGEPGEVEKEYGLGDYITGPLKGALDHVSGVAGAPVPVLGYCMGGDLVLAAAQIWPDEVAALALLATPWDLHAQMSAQARMFADAMPLWRPVLDAYGVMPVDLLQSFFASLDPGLAQRKFAKFARMDMDSAEARRFVLLEDWLNDGPPLSARVAMEAIGGWFGRNDLAKGHWLIDGRTIDPRLVRCRAFVAVPSSDRIVPPPSARALAELLPRAEIIEPQAGHIGMVVGSRARAGLWEPLNRWFATLE